MTKIWGIFSNCKVQNVRKEIGSQWSMNRGLFSRIIEWKRVEKLISLLLVFPLPSSNVLLSKELVNDLERASLNIVMLMGFFLRSRSKKNPKQRMNENLLFKRELQVISSIHFKMASFSCKSNIKRKKEEQYWCKK